MKEELASGLKNAIERGASLEQAIQSFLNAGYNPTEVSEAARLISSGATNILYGSRKEDSSVKKIDEQPKSEEKKQLQQPAVQKPSQPAIQHSPQQNTEEKPKKSKIGLIIIVITLLALFAGVLIYLLYRLSKGA